MKLTWYGHSCFLLESREGRVVFDPYAPGSVPGLELKRLEAELCLCSHGHSDHNYKAGVALSGKETGLKVLSFPSFHDGQGGALRGENTLHLVEAEGQRLLHLGDLGHELSAAALSQIGPVDLVMVPVGGYYTIDPRQAAAVAEALGARLVLPMHYRGPGFGYPVIGGVEDFLRLRHDVLRLPGPCIDLSQIEGPATVVPESFVQ